MTPTTEDLQSVLRHADQFISDWEENEGKDDPECKKAREAFDRLKPIIEQFPLYHHMVEKLLATVALNLDDQDQNDEQVIVAARHLVTGENPMQDVTFAVVLDGGVVQEVVSKHLVLQGLQCDIIDYDCSGMDDSDLSFVPQGDGKLEKAFVYGETVMETTIGMDGVVPCNL